MPVAVGVSASTVLALQTQPADYPGSESQTVTERTYPQGGTTATHVLGYVGNISAGYLADAPRPGL